MTKETIFPEIDGKKAQELPDIIQEEDEEQSVRSSFMNTSKIIRGQANSQIKEMEEKISAKLSQMR